MQGYEVDEDVSLETWVDGATGKLMTTVAGVPVPVVDHMRQRQAARDQRERERSAESDVRASIAGTCGALGLPVELADRVLGPTSPYRLQRDGGGRLLVLDRASGLQARDRDGRVLSPARLLELLRDEDPALLAQAPMEARIASGLHGSAPSSRPPAELALSRSMTAEEKISLGFKPGPARPPGLRTRRDADETARRVASGMRGR